MAQRRRGNWGPRAGAVAISVAAFLAFWRLAVATPHPAKLGAAATPSATPGYTLPTGTATTPIPLPGVPHGGTGLSR